ncbi:Fc.00g005330.m01.CDS01 [Cosmosporella sp. VM-42]
MDEKAGLPPYSAVGLPSPVPPVGIHRSQHRRVVSFRRRRALRLFAFACLFFIAFSQWIQLRGNGGTQLSLKKLNADLETCKKLRTKPKDPAGLGRDKNARYIEGGKPTLIKNATIWVGEPIKGTGEKDARAGKGWKWVSGDVFLEHGLIKKVESDILIASLPDNTITYDAHGRQLTSGVIDMHSHAGDYPLPTLNGNSDGNEMSDNITPWARSIDAIYPFDPQIQVIKSGGVTTSLILPGSGNNIGGEAYVIKHAVGKPDGRKEISVQDMLADPDRNWRYMKMACGENPKRVYGRVGGRPFSRMGESYDFRHAFEQARALIQKQDDWCDKADSVGVNNMDEYLPQEIAWETLGAALRGQVHINTHCYTVTDLEAMVDHTNEFEFPVRAFHHAHQSYLVPEILNRTWGGRAPASALFADNMYYKTEAYIGSEFAGKIIYANGFTPVYVSDNPVLNAQHVVFEAAKAFHYGLPYHAALSGVTSAPAELLGLGERIGKIKPGFDADVVVWDSDPMSVGAAPVQVWIDGTAQYEDPVELEKPLEEPIALDQPLVDMVEEATEVKDAFFTGITKVLLSDKDSYVSKDRPVNVAISDGKISCLGACQSEYEAMITSGIKPIALENGYLYHSFTGVGGTLGINAIDAEDATDNGANTILFTRAVDGLMLDNKKLYAAAKYGVTKGISAPKFIDTATHYGTSVGFVTSAFTSLEEGAVFASDLAVHYTLDVNVRFVTSYSAAFGGLRNKLFLAATGSSPVLNPFSEEAYLKKVVNGELVLALTIHGADGIATALKIKSEIEEVMLKTYDTARQIKLAIIGGAEAFLVAKELADADVGVILSPLLSDGEFWDARRALTGAPLTNGTGIDKLIDAGVVTAIGIKEDWEVRDLGFAAGIVHKNGGGRLSEKAALDLVSTNIYKILGADLERAEESGHFVVSEGSPLEIGSRIKAVGSGRDKVAAFVG